VDSPRVFRFAENELLYLGKLVDPEQPFGIQSMRADLAAESG
jgi:hypothetical protein